MASVVGNTAAHEAQDTESEYEYEYENTATEVGPSFLSRAAMNDVANTGGRHILSMLISLPSTKLRQSGL